MLKKIKSIFILKKLFIFITKFKYLKLINYNKALQKKLNISIDSYIKYYYQIEIELIPDQDYLDKGSKQNRFIYILNQKHKSFYHIYFDERKEEIKRTYIKRNEKLSKISILIDMEVKTISYLFQECRCLKEIKFIKFRRTDFTDFKCMFDSCENLINLDISKLKTDNVRNMTSMFGGCSSLKKLNLSNFQTDKVL